jgi:hypothetical protein
MKKHTQPSALGPIVVLLVAVAIAVLLFLERSGSL